MIIELRNPLIADPHPSPLKRARRLLGPYKRWVMKWLDNGDRVWRVIGFTEGATEQLTKRALIAYLARPFYMSAAERARAHSNHAQVVEIAKAFNRLGYVVDVVDWRDRTFVPTEQYDVFFGMGMDDNYDRLISHLSSRTRKIYYGTGMYYECENANEDARCEGIKARRGVTIRLPKRLPPNNWVATADAVVVIGNEYIASQYRPHNPRVTPIDNSAYLERPPDFSKKDFATARRNFLWFGSTGLVHKGLELVLEAFAEMPDVHVWICGPLHDATERDVVSAYSRELFETPNIHPVGWVRVDGDPFRELTDKCAFHISTPAAEGMPGAVLDTMARGLVPVVNRESGIDHEDFGVLLENSSIPEIRRVVRRLADTPPEICRRMAEGAYRAASTRYTLNAFSTNIERILRSILQPQ